MANLSAARAKSAALSAATADVVTLGRNFRRVEVTNRSGDAEIWVRIGGTNPGVGGDDATCLPAAIGSVVIESNERGNTVVRLISSGTPTYTVEGLEE